MNISSILCFQSKGQVYYKSGILVTIAKWNLIGKMDQMCRFSGAKISNRRTPGMCCESGKIRFPMEMSPPGAPFVAVSMSNDEHQFNTLFLIKGKYIIRGIIIAIEAIISLTSLEERTIGNNHRAQLFNDEETRHFAENCYKLVKRNHSIDCVTDPIELTNDLYNIVNSPMN
ncbi:hypothetical protein CEXT_612191 [Caerostris extrusa]|uniref:Uncharacterized protein n=1 Tax=Caerostris extrusa TaxID=172846 RepID=A0AAV4MSQ7_CAEEX|nr:hypothetical protein CEXT_612191 [Caerostris extrusa]